MAWLTCGKSAWDPTSSIHVRGWREAEVQIVRSMDTYHPPHIHHHRPRGGYAMERQRERERERKKEGRETETASQLAAH